MSLPLASDEMVTERVDDIPVLLAHLEQMGVPKLLDEHFPTHGNWQGLSLGWTATIWLVHILSRADHRLYRVQDWVGKHGETLHRCTGQVIEELDFSDDRLGAVLRYLNADEAWVSYEQSQGQPCCGYTICRARRCGWTRPRRAPTKPRIGKGCFGGG